MNLFRERRWPAWLGALALLCVLSASPAQAAFIGAYDPANFTLTNTNSDGAWVLNPDGSLTLTGPNNGSGDPGSLTFLILATVNGLVSFDWAYGTLDSAGLDRGGYHLNSVFTMLGDFDGASGTISFAVTAGDIFGFQIDSDDNTGEPGILTISNFEAPTGGGSAVPEPGSWLLTSAGLAAAASWLRRRRSV